MLIRGNTVLSLNKREVGGGELLIRAGGVGKSFEKSKGGWLLGTRD